VPDSERAKSLALLTRLICRISEDDRNKGVFIVAFGGGVIGDLAGFVASVYRRGVPYVQMPTTLLAQVDSAIGGKVAVDLPTAKNLAGAFYQPRAVLADTGLISSLDPRQIRSGLAEIIKYGVIKDPSLFAYLERNHKKILRREPDALEHIIATSASIKASVVEKDELDNRGLRIILNYGHTIGHAIEAASDFSKRYSHGEAVAIGMAAAADIATGLKILKARDRDRIKSLIRRCGLPTAAKGVEARRIYGAYLHDKKFIRGRNRFLLPERIGRVRVVERVPEGLVKETIKRCLAA
jgi:3-dehydroquinate synthase